MIEEREESSRRSAYHDCGTAVARTVRMELGMLLRTSISEESKSPEPSVAGAAKAVAARNRVARALYCMMKDWYENKLRRKIEPKQGRG